MINSFFACQQFPCFLFMAVKVMVYFHPSIAFCVTTETFQRTTLAGFRLVKSCRWCVTTSRSASFLSYLVHVLPHGTNIVIFIYIIIKVLREKAVLFKCLFLFFMKVVELYKWLNIIYLHKLIVFFATITGVSHNLVRQNIVTILKSIQKGNQC